MDATSESAPLRAEWTDLALRSGSIFDTWEWHELWWQHFSRRRRLHLGLGRRPDGSLAWLAPMFRQRLGPVRLLAFAGQGPSDHLGPISSPEDGDAAAAALARFVEEIPRHDLAIMRHLPGQRDWAETLGGVLLRREPSPLISLAGMSWDDYLATRSANLRQHARRKERVLERDHDLSYRMTDDPARLDEDLQSLYRLHSQRWQGPGAFAGVAGEFHRDFARVALQRGWLRLWFLELGGAPVAAWYGFRYGGADWFYQGGRDPHFEGLSVGTVLLAHTIREACNDGVSAYQLLRGDEDYKQRFANSGQDLQTIARPRAARGRAALAALRAVLALTPKIASRLAST